MIIQWLGESCFKIQTKGNQGEVTIVTDPFNDQSGSKMPKFQADIATISTDSDIHNNIEAIKGEPYVIIHPGEYETRDVFIYGVQAVSTENKAKTTLFKFFSEEISVAHLGSISSVLSDAQIEALGNIDILLLPIGAGKYLETKKAVELISQIDPRLVIPMGCDKPALDDFIKNCGLKSDTSDKLKITKKELMTDDTRAIILT